MKLLSLLQKYNPAEQYSAKAAPVMLSIKNTPDDEEILKDKFDKFERWHDFRACFQFITFVVLLYAFFKIE